MIIIANTYIVLFILIILCDRYHSYPHSTEKETEAQRSTCDSPTFAQLGNGEIGIALIW